MTTGSWPMKGSGTWMSSMAGARSTMTAPRCFRMSLIIGTLTVKFRGTGSDTKANCPMIPRWALASCSYPMQSVSKASSGRIGPMGRASSILIEMVDNL